MKEKKSNLFRVLTIALVLALTAGCGGGATAPPEAAASEDSTAPAENAPAADDREMVVGIPKVASSLDFFTQIPAYETFTFASSYDRLLMKDKESKIVPMLAESYEVSADAMTYTFHLRQGVMFTNGVEMTAEDCKYSLERLMECASTSFVYPCVDNVTIIDTYTFEINMKYPSVGFLDYMCSPYYSVVVSKAAYEEYGENYGTSADTIATTGPYIITDWRPSEYATYVANEDYYLGTPNIKKVRLKNITDVNAAIIALQTDEIQAFFEDIPGISYDAVANAENVNVVDFASKILFGTFMNMQRDMFADIRMRQAVAYAIDREEMLLVGCEGKGAVASYNGNRTAYTEGDPELGDIWYKPDMEKAKALVKEAGYEGATLTIKTYASDPYPKLVTIMQNALTQAGLVVDVQQMERSALFDEVFEKADFDICLVRWSANTEDMDEYMSCALHSDSFGLAGNWSLYSNPVMDAYLEDARGETDPEKRRGIYKQAIELFVDDVVFVPFYYPDGSRAYTKDLTIDDNMLRYDSFVHYSWAQ